MSDSNELRAEMMELAKGPSGTLCPVCDNHVQIYRRKFNARMALILTDIFRWFEKHPGEWLAVGNYCATEKGYVSGEHSKLAWWGLLDRSNDESNCGAKHCGLYRITPKGYAFVYNRIKVPRRVVEFQSGGFLWDDAEIGIIEALGEGFNYHELMRQDLRQGSLF